MLKMTHARLQACGLYTLQDSLMREE